MTADLYSSHVATITAAIRVVCRRHRLLGADAEDFESMVRLKFLEGDCAVLRKFEHRSSLSTFLVAVIQRLYLDHRNRVWGKWRPSAQARRLGDLAVDLERLLSRDGLGFDEAIETLRAKRQGPIDLAALETIHGLLPARQRRRFVGEESLEAIHSAAEDAESASLRAASEEVIRGASTALEQAVEQLEPSDRLLVRLRFYDGLSVAEIARAQGVEQKPLYRRLERCLATLRRALTSSGFRETEITEILRQEDASC